MLLTPALAALFPKDFSCRSQGALHHCVIEQEITPLSSNIYCTAVIVCILLKDGSEGFCQRRRRSSRNPRYRGLQIDGQGIYNLVSGKSAGAGNKGILKQTRHERTNATSRRQGVQALDASSRDHGTVLETLKPTSTQPHLNPDIFRFIHQA